MDYEVLPQDIELAEWDTLNDIFNLDLGIKEIENEEY